MALGGAGARVAFLEKEKVWTCKIEPTDFDLLIMSSDLLLSHINSVKSHISLSGRSSGGKETAKKQSKESGAEKGVRSSKPERKIKEKDYASDARVFLSQKKARIEQRVQLVNLAQPAKKNRKKLKKLIKLAKAV